jgi:hypothetical protein
LALDRPEERVLPELFLLKEGISEYQGLKSDGMEKCEVWINSNDGFDHHTGRDETYVATTGCGAIM